MPGNKKPEKPITIGREDLWVNIKEGTLIKVISNPNYITTVKEKKNSKWEWFHKNSIQ